MSDHATCTACGQPMTPGGGCRDARDRVRWGEESERGVRAQFAAQRGVEDPLRNPLPIDDPEVDRFLRLVHAGPYTDRPCPDCNCAPGHCHHAGCDREECATCGLQRIGCDCP